MLTREQILSVKDARHETVSVPEWGGDVFVRVFNGRSRDKVEGFLLKAKKSDDPAGFRSLTVSLSCCDEKGRLLFTEEDIPALEERSSDALDRVFTAALRINGLDKEAGAEARESFQGKP